MVRLFILFFVLALLTILPFLLWGEDIEQRLLAGEPGDWLRDYGAWAWAVGLLLLLIDLFLPIPATAVMTTLGILYGPILGGLLSAVGSFAAGSLGYAICRQFGRGAATALLGETDLQRGERLFLHYGGWLIALSRWLPVLPEVMSCMAGLVRMPMASFFIALACGALPFGLTFATLGHLGADQPLLAIGLSAFLPLILWGLIKGFIYKADVAI
ncbi:MAG: VTT domain-containing protein [Pseudomonadota bacterium]